MFKKLKSISFVCTEVKSISFVGIEVKSIDFVCIEVDSEGYFLDEGLATSLPADQKLILIRSRVLKYVTSLKSVLADFETKYQMPTRILVNQVQKREQSMKNNEK